MPKVITKRFALSEQTRRGKRNLLTCKNPQLVGPCA